MYIEPFKKRQWGFHPLQEAYWNSERENLQNLYPARVTFAGRDHARVQLIGQDREQHAKVRGRMANERLVVGDWITVEILPGDHQFLPIHSLLPRLSSLKRQGLNGEEQILVSNMNYVCLVTSFNQDFNLRRIERGIAMIHEGQAEPIVVINKLDLVTHEQAQSTVAELRARIPTVEVYACSATQDLGIRELSAKFAVGQTVAVLGMSGVGKSSVINRILGTERLETSEIREDDDRGRHTTTHRELIQSPQGFWVIDSPGIREFSIAGDDESLDGTFSDIKELMLGCRFGNCSHLTEPGCRVLAAVESGNLNRDRWLNFLKMQREIEHHLHRKDKAYQSEKRKQRVRQAKALRQSYKRGE